MYGSDQACSVVAGLVEAQIYSVEVSAELKDV